MRGTASTIAVPTRAVFDVLRALRHEPPKAEPADMDEKTRIAVTPVVSYNPASGVGIGIAGSAAFYEGSRRTLEFRS